MKKITLLFYFIIATAYTSVAQNLGALINGSLTDANKLAQNYLAPIANGMGVVATGGWFNDGAKSHKLLGFDIQLGLNVAATLPNARAFTFNQSDYQSLRLVDGSQSATMQTVVGSSDAKEVGVWSNGYGFVPGTTTKVSGFNTTLAAAYAIPYLQVGLGVGMGTEISIRYLPIDISSASLVNSLGTVTMTNWGVGVKHDIGQWIPVFKQLPLLHLSGQVVYSHSGVAYTPVDIFYPVSDAAVYSDGSAVDKSRYIGQSLALESNTWMGNVIFSINLPVFLTPYVGVGFIDYKSSIKFNGKYAIPNGTYTGNPPNSQDPQLQVQDYQNPISLNYSSVAPNISVGLDMHMLLFRINVGYNLVGFQYQSFHAGLGFSFR